MGINEYRKAGCFLIGSGPSLKCVDITQLANLDTISFNRSYVAWERWGFTPTFYACLDPVVFEDNVPEIHGLLRKCLRTHFFLPDSAQSFGIKSSAQVSIVKMSSGEKFATDISALTDFGNVGATSIQLLALLGYRRIAMVGVDARYEAVNAADVVAGKDGFVFVDGDPNHFCPEYAHGKRQSAHPDLGRILGQWPQVASECRKHGIEVCNATPGSALDCFPTSDFADAIGWLSKGENYLPSKH